MEEMSKKTKRLEKENLALSRKSETTNRNLLEMAEERTRHQKELDTLKKNNIKLENICRALQRERTNSRQAEGEELLEDDNGDSEEEFDEESEELDGSDGSDEDVDEDTEDENLEAELRDLRLTSTGPVKS
ncbi:myosin-like coiled-coil protein-domain-containing protein [Geopyxis carbonaria]|nr:myosin-like coiled-coil protein-domain-containing protein [Geopyxis carbonaria]